ncbi:aldo/keto reductase [Acholeplasma hippikon]|uniref:Glyoxal reductase n=1 Tax=Acholeplasma hippikon TaxID=264636 RepID=A0A449BIL2_9MOLU|nr:aldo/keto reductase [Acholeplasma hippikon]VEU82278.1 Glyoxal reductase [Acholeplasma hippikon]
MKQSTSKQVLTIFYISLIVNILLTVIKLTFGYLYKSQSLLSDGFNSLADILVSMGLILTMKIATKAPDFDHPYGHQKYEGVTFLTLGFVILLTGGFIGYDGLMTIINKTTSIPSKEAIIVASAVLMLKLFVAILNYKGAKKYNTPTLKADSVNHISDAFVTLFVLISVALYHLTGLYIEHIVSLIIGIFVIKTALSLLKEGLSYLVDEVPSVEFYDQVRDEILKIPGVIQIDMLKMRKHVNYIYIDAEIGVHDYLSLKKAHDISEKVHDHIETTFENVLHIMIHVNPVKEKDMEYIKLNNGMLIPMVGMGTNTFGKIGNEFGGEINMDTKELLMAYDNGYRLIDTAIMYRNEAVIGKSLKETKIGRDEIFVTSKISTKGLDFNHIESIKNKIDQSLVDVGSYIDIYLIHHPSEKNEENLILWNILIEYYKENKFKAIGVSNFNVEQLTYLINHSKVKPMINQIESNPSRWNHEIIKFCIKNDIVPEAWGPLDPVPNKDLLLEIGKKYNKSWAQVLLRYQLQRGVVVIPKSHNNMRQQENINIFDFRLTQADIDLIEN